MAGGQFSRDQLTAQTLMEEAKPELASLWPSWLTFGFYHIVLTHLINREFLVLWILAPFAMSVLCGELHLSVSIKLLRSLSLFMGMENLWDSDSALNLSSPGKLCFNICVTEVEAIPRCGVETHPTAFRAMACPLFYHCVKSLVIFLLLLRIFLYNVSPNAQSL